MGRQARQAGDWAAEPGELGFYLTSLAVMPLVALIISFTRVSDLAHTATPISIWESLAWDGTSCLATFMLLPAIVALAKRFGREPSLPRSLAVHAAATIPFSAAHVAMMGVFRWVGYAALGGRYDLAGLFANGFYEYRKDVITYGSIVLFYWGWRAWRGQAAAPVPRGAAEVTLEVRDGARRTYVRARDILWIEAAGNYAELHLAGRSLLHRASLASLESLLAGDGFARIHRARLVNRAEITALATNAAGDFTLTLRDGRALNGSRRYRAALTTTTPA